MNDSHGLADLNHAVTTAYPNVTLEPHVDPVGDLVLDKIVVPAGVAAATAAKCWRW